MQMKKSLVVLALLVAASLSVLAQGKPVVSPTTQDAIAAIRGQIQSDRQTLVAGNLGLTESEGQAFWPLYREYRTEAGALGDRTVKLITDYAKNFDSMTDAQAKTLLDEFLSVQKEEADLKAKWSKKLLKILPAKKLARFFQIENKLDLLVKLAIAQEVPLVE
jgi:hypothetical protein